jgi:hypothetical protein
VPLFFVEAPFFRRLFLKQNGPFHFPSRHFLMNDILPWVAEKIKEKYVSSILESCHCCTISFDLWMSRVGVDTFVMIVHFLSSKWKYCHVTIGFLKQLTILGVPWLCKSMMCLQSITLILE